MCTINVTFTPAAAGSRTGAVSIADSMDIVPLAVPLNGTGVAPPSITSLSPTVGNVGTSVTITGTNFGATQRSSTVTFNGTAATPTSWSTNGTSIAVPVPTGATTGDVLVTVGGATSNAVSFTVQAANNVVSLVQHTGKDAGTATSSSLAFNANNSAGNFIGVCIRAGHSGQVFTVTDAQGNMYRKASQLAETLDAPNGHALAIYYAENIKGGANTVTVSDTIDTLQFAILEYSGAATANSLDVTASAQGNSASPNSGNATTTASGDLLLGGISTADARNFTEPSNYVIREFVPAEPNTKLVAEAEVQTAAGGAAASESLSASDPWGAVLAAFKAASGGGGGTAPTITSLSKSNGTVGDSITITGTNFGTSQGAITVTFNGTVATVTSSSSTSIATSVPAGAITGYVVVTVSGLDSNGIWFTVNVSNPPTITSISPQSGTPGTSVTITGTNFGDTQGISTVEFDKTSAVATSWNRTSIQATVPVGVTGTIAVKVTINGVTSNGVNFTVNNRTVTAEAICISSLSAMSGGCGTRPKLNDE